MWHFQFVIERFSYEDVRVLLEPGLLLVTVGDWMSGLELVGVRSLGENPCCMWRKSIGALMSTIWLRETLRDLKERYIITYRTLKSAETGINFLLYNLKLWTISPYDFDGNNILSKARSSKARLATELKNVMRFITGKEYLSLHRCSWKGGGGGRALEDCRKSKVSCDRARLTLSSSCVVAEMAPRISSSPQEVAALPHHPTSWWQQMAFPKKVSLHECWPEPFAAEWWQESCWH